LRKLAPLMIGIGDIGAGIGVYWAFRYSSEPAATAFLQLALFLWLGIALLDSVLRAIQQARERKQTRASSPRDAA
jgi:hypothetical protein